mmetsp:Transcript_23409/g.35511  ORF Transcript_23409/g.35511 Transcript_23409/m.35511 type:complete len:135 (+) Transcript_23409:947-1351(+)
MTILPKKLLQEVQAVDSKLEAYLNSHTAKELDRMGVENTDDEMAGKVTGAIHTVLLDWNKLKHAVDVMRVDAANMDTRHQGVKQILIDSLKRISDKICDSDRQTQLIMSLIGSNHKLSDEGSQSLWKAIGRSEI